MDNELLYQIGEAVLMEVDDINDVSYPREETDACIIVAQDGRRYKLILKEIV